MSKFELKLRKRNIPETELIDEVKRVAQLLGKDTITKVEYDGHGRFGATTLLRRFGSWHKTLEAAGLRVVHNVNISEEQLFENIATVWQHLGRQPFGREMEKSGGFSKYSLGTYEDRFGTWNKSLEKFVEYINGPSEGLPAAVPKNKKETPETGQSRTPKKINWRLRATILIRDNCICQMCGASPAKDPSVVLHVDHVVPWTKGGETVPNNLRTLCSVCNIGKSDIDPNSL